MRWNPQQWCRLTKRELVKNVIMQMFQLKNVLGKKFEKTLESVIKTAFASISNPKSLDLIIQRIKAPEMENTTPIWLETIKSQRSARCLLK